MTAHTTDTGMKSLNELRAIEAHLSTRLTTARAEVALFNAGLASVRNAIARRTSFWKPCAATQQQAARLASFGIMPPPMVNPIGCNVEMPGRGRAV